MKKTFCTIVGWLTFPGYMSMNNTPGLEIMTNKQCWGVLLLAVLATLSYGGISSYFGRTEFIGTHKEFLCVVAGIISGLNFLMAGIGTLALWAGTWDSAEDTSS
ncbi:hypothetical protein A3I99_01210 [Candidatus Kaiserbacteria bacterium RIFCSPLOWO2_02_FULL_45_11b]|uniref:Uncharacterized protein n=1 Tax=Candidatus Kaiserbacteria bacterium RIFCSPLOWO2_12_FULL_45_26 TaxID=1798525 RepID=A0A1F6FFP6_9BACT|nr:MAG: hypothetical protein A2Z56_00380 [Candidatus Kaiserbacteria bacterium RIFCSPHIGHO2_12_45_16]OGG70406.1 MAG: hypothetical protein A2929_01290 [Candidatus Kaiserbacteria bacterium RIFCSPLOWO2_01_FULL_45_25]OGG80938.1 MAG: hypothetical protein A3I99_01210 [Candidatus Kaiserbacteria bacterium RIFCSPLOWO2_02_FULL_45_11b]OGG84678.1 MAG: hypothetical protein A3G90_01155 [Candidatus Kaiserbacteria bacterium RIFCSPLOWO2_12_FULL_45_26]